MRHIYIVGIGTGNPEHLTVQAINALNAADVILIPSKGAAKTELADVRRDICQRYVTNPATRFVGYDVPSRRTADRSYVQSVDEWHDAISATYERLFLEHLTERESAAFLVWGDPGLYDSTLRILERVVARGKIALDYSVVPGITSIQALTASHRIPLNLVGKPVQITPVGGWPRAFRALPKRPSSCSTASKPSARSMIPMPISIGAPISALGMRSRLPAGWLTFPSAFSRPAPKPAPGTDGSWISTSCARGRISTISNKRRIPNRLPADPVCARKCPL